jgi:hypothetical protein
MTHQELLNMTHQELLVASNEIKFQYKEAKKIELYNSIKIIFKNGYKHIQLYNGCLKVKRNKNSVFYSSRNGKGTGGDLYQSSDLKYITDKISGLGWGNIISFK